MNHFRFWMMWRWWLRRVWPRMVIGFWVMISFSMMHYSLSVIRLVVIHGLWMVLLLVINWFWIVRFRIVHRFLMISWVATILRLLVMVLWFIGVAKSWSVV